MLKIGFVFRGLAVKYPPDEFVGQLVLGRYRVVGVLAKGGMGVIYLARSEGAAGFTRPVVVKRILSGMDDDHTVVNMFKREARIMSNLRHPGVVSVIDFGRERDSYFMVLDYIHGVHLGRWLRFTNGAYGPFPLNLALHIIVQVLDALHYAHTLKAPDGNELQVVHRDVTPSNILIDVEGHAKLADFGIARMRTDATEAGTGESQIKGKFSYLAPELLKGSEPSPASDVYSTAVVLHEVLMGKNVFRTAQLPMTMSRVLNHVPEALDAFRNDVSPELAAAVAKGLNKNPHERYSSALEFAVALRALRPENAEETQAKLQEAVTRDFFDPRMAQVGDADSLVSLERAWRDPVPTSRLHEAKPAYTTDRPPAPHTAHVPQPMPVPEPVYSRPAGLARPKPRPHVKPPGSAKDLLRRLKQKPFLLAAMVASALLVVLALGGLVQGVVRLLRLSSGG